MRLVIIYFLNFDLWHAQVTQDLVASGIVFNRSIKYDPDTVSQNREWNIL